MVYAYLLRVRAVYTHTHTHAANNLHEAPKLRGARVFAFTQKRASKHNFWVAKGEAGERKCYTQRLYIRVCTFLGAGGGEC